jgi:phosphatidate phosphatase LPIN
MIIDGTVDIHEDEGKITCTSSEAVKNSEHHLCAQNSGSSREGQSKEPVLKSGRNLIRYTLVSEKGVAIASAEANIYLWSALDSVIVSDIDGTVTKDNVGGVIDTVVQEKYEHIHNGICKFFQQLAMISPMEDMGDLNETDNKKGQVRFMYLTSRPISYVNTTRKLLVSVSQTCEVNEELHTLPPGPMMCNTIPLTSVLYSELIAKNTHMFKSDVLARQVVLPFVAARGEDWRKVKKVNSSRTLRVTKLDEVDEDVRSSSDYIDNRSTRERSGPIDDRLFLAGFGNNMRDAMAYEMAGMDRNDIYIINSKSRIMCIGERGQSQNLDEINSECFETEWISDVVDSCCLGKSEMPGGELNGENPQGLAYESKIKSQSNSQVVFNCPSIHQPINQSANKSKKGGDSVSKSKKSIRAFTNKKSFTRFPSFTSSSSGTSSSSTKTLYQGYDDPRLLEKVRRRMQGIHYSLLSQT